MFGALRDCVPILQQVRHETSAQVMMDQFQKEISDMLNEVRRSKNLQHQKPSFHLVWVLYDTRTTKENIVSYPLGK